MLAKLIVNVMFGSIWNLKTRCIQTRHPFLKRAIISIYEFYQYENNSSIAWNSAFENEPCFPHGMKSIFVAGAAQIGENAVIFQQTTIGSVSMPDSIHQGAPKIGKNCYIGSGAAWWYWGHRR